MVGACHVGSIVVTSMAIFHLVAGAQFKESFWRFVIGPFGWLLLALLFCNPAPLIAEYSPKLVPPFFVAAWLVVSLCCNYVINPSLLLEWGWNAMIASFTLFQICIFGSALVHMTFTITLNIWPVIFQRIPCLQRFKIQPEKRPATAHDWWHVLLHITASQICVQLPLVAGLYFFVTFFNIPHDYESMPSALSMSWRIVFALVIDDTWVYWGHRFLHDKRIYKYIHKVHHTYTVPFAPNAEYEHPFETVFLGAGFFIACMVLTSHLGFLWVWLFARLLVTYESHSGYDMPYSIPRLFPCYSGAREHDWHHQCFQGNYAPTFLWWDRICSTNQGFLRTELGRRKKLCEQSAIDMELCGDAFYASQGMSTVWKAGDVDKSPASVPFSTCLVTGSEGLVGTRLVKMLARRGIKRIICLDIADGPSEAFRELSRSLKDHYGVEVGYVKADISKAEELVHDAFHGVEVVFHLAALVGPFYKHELYDAVNHRGALNVLQAFLDHGGSAAGPNAVLVDCSTPSTRYPLVGGWEGLMEKDMVYQDRIHEYATTKAKGEKAILDANGVKCRGRDGHVLATCAVAPHQVYAPEDKLFLPSMLETAQSRKLRIFGLGNNLVSFTHADNISHGLILAAAKLWCEGSTSKAAGEFFVVTDTGSRNFWDAVDSAVTECGMPSLWSKTHLSPALLSCVAYMGAAYTWLFGRFVKLTPFTLRMLLINRTFSTAKARHILAYAPVVSFEDGWSETVAAAKKLFSTSTS